MTHAQFFDNRLIQGLSRKQAELLFAAGAVSILPSGSIVLNEGDVVDKLYVLLSGKVQVFLPQDHGRVSDVKLNVLVEHDCFGEYAFIDEQPASASIVTLCDVEMYEIGHDELQSMLGTHTDIGCVVYRNLLRVLVERLRASNAELDLFTLPEYEPA